MRIAIVTRQLARAEVYASELDVIRPGSSTMGRRFDLIVIAEPLTSESEVEQAKLDDWYNTSLLTRLAPGGQVVGHVK